MEIQYVGEHLLPGQIGNFFVYLSFVSSLLAVVAYFFYSKDNALDQSWRKIARTSFRIHSISVFGIVGTLFYLLVNHFFEYHYIWQHSSRQMDMKYILSCFWEGQEGSFLLWTFWHVILGNILMKVEKQWEAPVMTVFSLVQVFLSSMLLGVVVFNYKVGSNPFGLLREHADFINLPFVKSPTYLNSLDGRGLNPLLQNYWMTIHPPTLFLGFAATLIPFAYAIAGLWTKKYQEWVKPALPWTFFGIMILGVGILMGGAWAYESLSFGGFWAWDPVENASLVPWLVLVGAGHVMLISKNRGGSIMTLFILTFLSFLLILYSTFLTRSGILGESSVHAFTDLGMSGQLLIYLLFFTFLAIFLIVVNYKTIPRQDKEEELWSREFWMFIGSLVLFLLASKIIYTTSFPVFNKVLGTNLAPPINLIQHHNSWAIPFAIITALLIAIGQFFKYKNTDIREFIKKISISFIVSLVLSGLWIYYLKFSNYSYGLLLFASIFAVIANVDYLIRVIKGKLNFAGSSIAHIGFALILLGALISTSKSVIISQNTSGVDIAALGSSINNNENIMLNKGDTLRMGKYFVTYKGQTNEGINAIYEVEYLTKNADDSYNHEFTLHPFIQLNPRMGNVAEPDTRHFLTNDVYTHISYAEIEDAADKNTNQYREANISMVNIGDTIFSTQSIIILQDVSRNVDKAKYDLIDSDIAVSAKLLVKDINNISYTTEPVFVLRGNRVIPIESAVEQVGVKFSFDKIDPESGKIQISTSEKKSNSRQFIIMKAIIFPFINILWAGCIIMAIGTTMAMVYRIKRN